MPGYSTSNCMWQANTLFQWPNSQQWLVITIKTSDKYCLDFTPCVKKHMTIISGKRFHEIFAQSASATHLPSSRLRGGQLEGEKRRRIMCRGVNFTKAGKFKVNSPCGCWLRNFERSCYCTTVVSSSSDYRHCIILLFLCGRQQMHSLCNELFPIIPTVTPQNKDSV